MVRARLEIYDEQTGNWVPWRGQLQGNSKIQLVDTQTTPVPYVGAKETTLNTLKNLLTPLIVEAAYYDNQNQEYTVNGEGILLFNMGVAEVTITVNEKNIIIPPGKDTGGILRFAAFTAVSVAATDYFSLTVFKKLESTPTPEPDPEPEPIIENFIGPDLNSELWDSIFGGNIVYTVDDGLVITSSDTQLDDIYDCSYNDQIQCLQVFGGDWSLEWKMNAISSGDDNQGMGGIIFPDLITGGSADCLRLMVALFDKSATTETYLLIRTESGRVFGDVDPSFTELNNDLRKSITGGIPVNAKLQKVGNTITIGIGLNYEDPTTVATLDVTDMEIPNFSIFAAKFTTNPFFQYFVISDMVITP